MNIKELAPDYYMITFNERSHIMMRIETANAFKADTQFIIPAVDAKEAEEICLSHIQILLECSGSLEQPIMITKKAHTKVQREYMRRNARKNKKLF